MTAPFFAFPQTMELLRRFSLARLRYTRPSAASSPLPFSGNAPPASVAALVHVLVIGPSVAPRRLAFRGPPNEAVILGILILLSARVEIPV